MPAMPLIDMEVSDPHDRNTDVFVSELKQSYKEEVYETDKVFIGGRHLCGNDPGNDRMLV